MEIDFEEFENSIINFTKENYKKLLLDISKEYIDKNLNDKTVKENFIQKFANKNVYLYGAGDFLRDTLKNYDFS